MIRGLSKTCAPFTVKDMVENLRRRRGVAILTYF